MILIHLYGRKNVEHLLVFVQVLREFDVLYKKVPKGT